VTPKHAAAAAAAAAAAVTTGDCRKVYAMAETYGGIFKIKAPGRTVVVVTDPDLLAQLTAQEFTGVTKPADLYYPFALVRS
jgi:hypothetical protein